MQDIEQKIAVFIKQHNLMPEDGNILLAISGGADSLALLYILKNLFHKAIHIGHINHQLRGIDSLKDQEFVKTLAERLNLPVTIESVDVRAYVKENKLSIETAARKLRLDALCRIADKNNCQYIATAHQKNDNAETVIHRILRGTGFKGLAGIRPSTVINNKVFVRPLLCVSRSQIEDYLRNQSIRWQTDHTNLDCRFTRNRIRHKLLPYLRDNTDNLPELISSLSGHCSILASNIETQAKSAIQTCILSENDVQITVDSNNFLNQPRPVQVELMQLFLAKLDCGLQKFTAGHYCKIIEFVRSAQTGKTLVVPRKIKITTGQNKFFITAQSWKVDEPQNIVALSVPGKTTFANWQIETKIVPVDSLDIKTIKNKNDNFLEWFDFGQIEMPLVVRCRQKGDRFRPFGFKETKKIGKFITSAKIDSQDRRDVFLLCDSKKILWLAPIRRSSEAAITVQSRSIIQVKITITPFKT